MAVLVLTVLAADPLMTRVPRFNYSRLSSNCFDPTIVGFSALHREIRAWRIGNSQQRPMLVVAGQHGDEPCSMLAAEKLIRNYEKLTTGLVCPAGTSEVGTGANACRLRGDQPAVWIIPCLNPDGAIENQRQNAQGVDLNRDHLARLTPEVQCLHRFIQRIDPCCVLDLHCFPSRRRWMRELNIEHAADVLVDWATGPAATQVIEPCPVRLSRIRQSLRNKSDDKLLVSRYWLRSDRGRLRHSTPDWLDLRNQVAACYRIPTYLIEGREPLRHETEQADRTIAAMVLAVTEILQAFHREPVSAGGGASQSRLPVAHRMPTRFRYQSRKAFRTHLRDRTHHHVIAEPIGTKYGDHTLPTRYVPVADSFWIPKSLHGVIAHLQRLQAPLHEGESHLREIASVSVEVTQFQFCDYQPSRSVRRNDRQSQFSQTQLLLTEPQRFVVLTPSISDRVYWNALLDPRHKFSICRMHRPELNRPAGDYYPIFFHYESHESKVGLK